MSQKVKEKLADFWHTISLYNGSSIENSFVKKDSNKRRRKAKENPLPMCTQIVLKTYGDRLKVCYEICTE